MVSRELCIAKREMATRNGNGHAVRGSLKTGAGKLVFAELSQASRRILSQALKISSKGC